MAKSFFQGHIICIFRFLRKLIELFSFVIGSLQFGLVLLRKLLPIFIAFFKIDCEL